jgi:hypothetical protein
VKATLLLRQRIPFSESSFAELVLWHLPRALPGSAQAFQYRLAFVRAGVCVVRFDNEFSKGSHKHVRGRRSRYRFVAPDRLIEDFLREARRSDDEDRDA